MNNRDTERPEIDDGTSTSAALDVPQSEEDHRAPARALPTGRTWTVIFAGLVGLLAVMATISWLYDS